MSDSAKIQAEHPLFKELRNGMRWYSTSAQHYRRIRTDKMIKPNNGRIDRWLPTMCGAFIECVNRAHE
jgi:hypothetical protein